MNAQYYAILGYVVALGLMWGYAIQLYLEHRALKRRRKVEEGV